ncbi:MAG: flagellar biosynthetic protein FliR [Betaproteobacteria bacterium]|nr:flagellar biosynthetic protein FliR [Betaproteobacteria bacterium]MBL8535634.1 flagellar biosynthetic protein FliR [Betaproteobacteria bacterium]
MIELAVAQLQPLLVSVGWPFVRILAFFSTEPVLGNRSVPVRVKVALSVFVAILVSGAVPGPAGVEPFSAAGLLVLVQQLVIGVAMGFAARITVSAAEMAGQLAGLQVGLGFAVFFDPQGSGQTPVVAQFYGIIAVLTLLATNGHYTLLTALVESFRTLPMTPEPISGRGFLTLVTWGGEIFKAGLMMSMPVVGALLVANIAIGILTRAAPQLNIFAVGFPVTLALGFVMLYLSVPLIVPAIESLESATAAAIMRILEQLRPAP